jgi:hypothetical protein
MIKFIIAARRKREDTQERYFYEWGIVHVALMVTSPAVMRLFKRYVQHYSIGGIGDDMLRHPLSDMEWDNMADHWVETHDDFMATHRVEDYVRRMQPHKFGDSNFVLALATGRVVFERPGFMNGGVKLIHFLRRKPDVPNERFNELWQGAHAELVAELNEREPIIRKYVQNRTMQIQGDSFKGSLFEKGETEGFAGIEEFWFDSLDQLARLRRDPRWKRMLDDSEAGFVDASGSFSMVTTERLIYDYTLGAASSPTAAVLNPHSLEAAIYAQGLGGWNVPAASGASLDARQTTV